MEPRRRRVKGLPKGGGYYAAPRRRPQRAATALPAISGRSILRLGLFLSLILATYFVWNLFGIKQVQQHGNKAVTGEQLLKYIKEESGGGWRSNLLTLDATATSERVQRRDYRLESVTIKRDWPNRLIVTITERSAALRWQTGDDVWVIDSKGTAIALQKEFPVTDPIVVDSTGLPVKAGTRIVPERFVKFTQVVARSMPVEAKLGVSELRVFDTTSELYVKSDKGYVIKFDTTREAGGEIEALVKVLKELSRDRKTPAEYIDLRIAGKAYYR